MDKLQLVFFFISGFLVSRVLIKAKIPEHLVGLLLSQKNVGFPRIVFYLIASSALLSVIIPNAITVLTLLPVISLLQKPLEKALGEDQKIPTILSLTLIYGANIGGMGSITATPANGILIGFLKLNNVAGVDQITFTHWLMWGIPLVLVFILVSWGILIFSFSLYKTRHIKIVIDTPFPTANSHLQRIAIIITSIYFSSSLILSTLISQSLGRGSEGLSPWTIGLIACAGVITLGVFITLFFIPFSPPKDRTDGRKAVLLTLKDCYSGLPMKGIYLLIVVGLLGGVIVALEKFGIFSMQDFLVNNIETLLSDAIPALLLLLIIALFTTFTTEFLSNTVVQISLFAILLPLADGLNISAVQGLVVVTLSCTCAFMSPLATGVNGLAFGGIKGVSLREMITTGFMLNVVGAVIISTWIYLFVG